MGFKDHSGALWFGTTTGLSRLIPWEDSAPEPPPIYIGRLRIGGDEYPVSALGDTSISGVELASGQNHIQIDFGGLAFSAGESLRYQYRLEGADSDWSPFT